MYVKKTKYASIADSGCSYCNGLGYLEIFNAYDPEFKEKEACPICLVNYAEKQKESRADKKDLN